MRIVVFGLAITSSWGNGHATLWRGLVRALGRLGVETVFFERDQPWYAAARDLPEIAGGRIVVYPDWEGVEAAAIAAVADADAAIVTSFCPDAVAATRLVAGLSRPVRVFYDLDTPVTLGAVEAGREVGYIGPELLQPFDLVLSFTGGPALEGLRRRLGARRVAPLYGHADPDVHAPTLPTAAYRSDLSYLGTFAEDRQESLLRLLVEPARLRPNRRFLVAGAQYHATFPWQPSMHFVHHLPPSEHAAFFSSSRLTLNVTRRAMAENGWCPSGRLFEAAAAGASIVSDVWPGLDELFTPGREIFQARDTADVLAALERDDAELAGIGRAARERVLAAHTSHHRALDLLALLDGARNADWPGSADGVSSKLARVGA